jgi:hypothetical protein
VLVPVGQQVGVFVLQVKVMHPEAMSGQRQKVRAPQMQPVLTA